jgi:hypothetical protein
MGVKVSRIEKEFLFRGAINGKAPINVHGYKKEATGYVLDFDDERIVIDIGTENDFKVGEEVRVYLWLQNNMHSFKSTIRKREQDRIEIDQPPDGMYKSLRRKHERTKCPQTLKAYFTIKGTNFELNFPKTSRYFPVEKPESLESFDDSSIQGLVEDFRRKMQKRVAKNEIVLFRNRQPSTFEERLMHRTAKIIWIPTIKEGYAVEDPFPDGRILTRKDIVEETGNTEFSDKALNTRVEDRLDEKLREGVYSEVYCPLLYNQFFIGYLHVCNSEDRKETISEGVIEYMYQFAKVVCYSLEVHGYFTSLANRERNFETSIIDISASGLLFAHPMKELSRELMIHTDIALTLKFPHRKILIGARIVRKFKDRDHLYIGLQFMDMAQEDFRFLFEEIYGKRYHESYDDLWEGGIPPPELVWDDSG